MISGFEEITKDLTAEEKKAIPILVKGLRHRIGKNSAITNKKMQEILRKHYNLKISGPRMRKIINNIRIYGLVPCLCATSNGYYVAASKKELQDYLQSLQERIESQQYLLDKLKIQSIREHGV